MEFCIIGSGSRGNMTYIRTAKTKIIIDAGISLLDASKRVDFDLGDIDAVLITHEHTDHTKFLPTILKRTNAILYINKLSFDSLSLDIKMKVINYRIKFIEENKKYRINDLEFSTLKLSHDSANIFGFVIEAENKRLAYVTDTGFFPIHYVNILKSVDAIIIEANHDITMLLESDRSWYLKERILSPLGHMSNHICGQILEAVLNSRQQYVILAHISLECNSFEIIDTEIVQVIKKTYQGEIVMAEQFEATRLYQIK